MQSLPSCYRFGLTRKSHPISVFTHNKPEELIMSFGGASSLKGQSILVHYNNASDWDDMTEYIFTERKEDEIVFHLRFPYKGTPNYMPHAMLARHLLICFAQTVHMYEW